MVVVAVETAVGAMVAATAVEEKAAEERAAETEVAETAAATEEVEMGEETVAVVTVAATVAAMVWPARGRGAERIRRSSDAYRPLRRWKTSFGFAPM